MKPGASFSVRRIFERILHPGLPSRHWNDSLWLLLGILWAAGIILGYIGFARHAAMLGESATPLDLIYLTLQLIPMNSGYVSHPVSWELEVARLLIPLVAASTAVQALASLFRQQIAILGLRFARGHVIVCGLSRKGFLLVENFRSLGEFVVVIEHNEHNDWIEPCRTLGAVVLIGDATDPILLHKAGLERARSVIAVVDDDGINAEVAVRARALSTNRAANPLTCVIHIVDPQLCNLLREREMSKDHQPTLRLELFNVFESGARILLEENPLVSRDDGSAPHWLVVGVGHMGESLIVQAAQRWHSLFPNNHSRMRITVIDQVAHARIEALKYQYTRLEKVCALQALEMNIHSPEFMRGEFLFTPECRRDVDRIFICLDDDPLGLHASLTLLQRLRPDPVPIAVRMAEKGGLATLLHEQNGKSYYANLSAFALLDRTCTPDLLLGGTHEVLALALHDEYLHQQLSAGAQPGSRPDLFAWRDLPELYREAYRRQVDRIGLKLETIGCAMVPITDWELDAFHFTEKEVETLARMEHDYLYQDVRRGDSTVGTARMKPAAKNHTGILSWEQIPEPEREKYRAGARDLPSFLARAGSQIIRLK
jgi:hypothetical protein